MDESRKELTEKEDESTRGPTEKDSQKISPTDKDSEWRQNKKLIQRMLYMFENSLWTDCTFNVDNSEETPRIFKCHKNILASASCVFERMFFGLLKETDVRVNDIAPETFKMMLWYIYSEELPLSVLKSVPEILSVSRAADKYQIMDLLKYCEENILRLMDSTNTVQCYEFAYDTNRVQLMNSALEIMLRKTTQVLQSECFLDARPDTIERLLRETTLNVASERVLWDAILRWGNNQCSKEGKKLREVLQPFLSEFRFLTMTVKEFADGPANSDVLTDGETKVIFMHLSSPQISVPFPDMFSSSRNVRCSQNPTPLDSQSSITFTPLDSQNTNRIVFNAQQVYGSQNTSLFGSQNASLFGSQNSNFTFGLSTGSRSSQHQPFV